MANITELIKNIRTAIFGKDVRESIAKAIEQCYEDASMQDNANMEVTDARGFFNTLKKRLDNSDSVKADKVEIEDEKAIRENADSKLQNQINSLASGSPLVANSISEMTDTSRVYVNTTDGHWYTHNGTSWGDGGVYQATEIADGSITVEKTNFMSKANKLEMQNNEGISDGIGYTIQDGIITLNGTATKDILIPVMIKRIDLKKLYLRVVGEYSNKVLIRLHSGEIQNVSCYAGETRLFEAKETIDNAYIRIANETVLENYQLIPILCEHAYIVDDYEQYLNKYFFENIGVPEVNNIKEKQVSFVENGINLANPDFVRTNKIIPVNSSPGTFTEPQLQHNDSYCTIILPIKANKTYYINTKVRKILITNDFAKVNYFENISPQNTKTITPEEDGLLYASFSNTNSGIMITDSESSDYEDFEYLLTEKFGLNNKQKEIVNKICKKMKIGAFENKKLVTLGDSIMAGDGNEGCGIGELISKDLNMNLTEYALGGATVAYNVELGTSRRNIISQLNELIQANSNPDYILIDGGTNDISGGSTVELGEVTEGYSETLDNTTFSGALEHIFKSIKSKYPDSKILFIRVHNMKSRGFTKQRTFGERAIEICNKWSIKVVDLYKDSGLNTNISSMLQYTNKTTAAVNGDSTHPTQEGYEKFYLPLIIAAMKEITKEREE